METESFANWLGQRLRERGKTQVWLADQLGVKPASVNRWLKGTIPESYRCAAIAEIFGEDETYVMALAGHRPDAPVRDPSIRQGERDLAALARQLSDDGLQQLVDVADVLLRHHPRQRKTALPQAHEPGPPPANGTQSRQASNRNQ